MNNLIESNKKIKNILTLDNRKNIAAQLYLVNPSTVFFENDEFRDVLYSIYSQISIKFSIPMTCIFLTGSAHIGFSLMKGHDFSSKTSDLDIAIVNPELFVKILTSILEETDSYNRGFLFKNNDTIKNYNEKLIRGVLHPLYFPNKIHFTRDWNRFFRNLTRENQKFFNKITACIYLSEGCFRISQEDSLRKYIEVWSISA